MECRDILMKVHLQQLLLHTFQLWNAVTTALRTATCYVCDSHFDWPGYALVLNVHAAAKQALQVCMYKGTLVPENRCKAMA